MHCTFMQVLFLHCCGMYVLASLKNYYFNLPKPFHSIVISLVIFSNWLTIMTVMSVKANNWLSSWLQGSVIFNTTQSAQHPFLLCLFILYKLNVYCTNFLFEFGLTKNSTSKPLFSFDKFLECEMYVRNGRKVYSKRQKYKKCIFYAHLWIL